EGGAGEVLADQHVVPVGQVPAGEREGEAPCLEPGAVQVLLPAAEGVLQLVDVEGERERAPGREQRGEGGLAAAGRAVEQQEDGCVHPGSLSRRPWRRVRDAPRTRRRRASVGA